MTAAAGRSPTSSTATSRPMRRARKWSEISHTSRHGKGGYTTVIDCHTKKVVGYAMDDNYKTPLIIEAVHMAARNVTFAHGAIFHSDRGSNYTSTSFAAALAEHGIRQSRSEERRV